MGLASIRAFTPLRLSLGGQPATHQLQAFRVLAVPLVPTSRLVNAATPFAQTDTASKPPTAGGKARAESMLEMSQGRCLLPKGPPERLRSSRSGIPFLDLLFILLIRAVSLNLRGCCSAAHAGLQPLHRRNQPAATSPSRPSAKEKKTRKETVRNTSALEGEDRRRR